MNEHGASFFIITPASGFVKKGRPPGGLYYSYVTLELDPLTLRRRCCYNGPRLKNGA